MSAHIFMLCDSDRDPLIQIASTYLSKSGPRIKGDLTIIPTKKVARFPEGETRRLEEGKLLLKASEGRYRIALDAKGRSFDTQQWSQRIEQLLAQRGKIGFLIGGASGHSQKVRDESDELWSLSLLTFPHKLALCVLAEQLYRTSEIAKQSPYAK